MRFSCSVLELSGALSIVTRAIAARSTMPIMEGVLIHTAEKGILLTCSDVSIGIEMYLEAEIHETGSCVLPGKLFAEIIRKLQQDATIDITIDAKNTATLRCQKSKTTLAGFPADEFPPLPEISVAKEIALPRKTLRGMIQRASFAIATDETRPILMGCLLETKGDTLSIVALDGFRLALRKTRLSNDLPEMSVVVPGKALNEIARIIDDSDEPVTLEYGKTHLSANMGGIRVVARLLEGEFIRYQQILPTEWQTRIVVHKETLDASIDLASLMAREGKNNLVKLHIEEGTLLITSNADLGDVREEIPVDFEGRELDIAFNVRYISDTLRAVEDEDVEMRFNSNVSPCVICPTSGDHFLYLALPVRVFTA